LRNKEDYLYCDLLNRLEISKGSNEKWNHDNTKELKEKISNIKDFKAMGFEYFEHLKKRKNISRVDLKKIFNKVVEEEELFKLELKELEIEIIGFDDKKYEPKNSRSPSQPLPLFLNLFKTVTFLNCDFYRGHIKELTVSYSFGPHCTFYNDWEQLPPKDSLNLFFNCSFKKKLILGPGKAEGLLVVDNLFLENSFLKTVIVQNLSIEKTFSIHSVKRLLVKKSSIKSLNFNSSGSIFLCNSQINYFHIWNPKKEDSFNRLIIKEAEINSLMINTFSNKIFKINKVKLINSTFSKVEIDRVDLRKLDINFIDIKKSLAITGSKIRKSLNLDNSLINNINMQGTDIPQAETTRETFRLIKHSFDKTGNTIEANKYFSKEMEAYRRELKKAKGSKEELLVFHIGRLLSNFGQSYIRPAKLLFILVSLKYLIIRSLNYNIAPSNLFTETLIGLNLVFDDFIKIITPTPLLPTLTPGAEFFSMLYNITFSVLVWQIIVALKRHTKR